MKRQLSVMFARISCFCYIIVILVIGDAMPSSMKNRCFNPEKDIKFRLYTRENRSNYFDLGNGCSFGDFNPNRPTRIFIHGYKSTEEVFCRYKEAYLDLSDYNFIAVDWTEGAKTHNYYSAKSRVRLVS